jgi:hypothetical protein
LLRSDSENRLRNAALTEFLSGSQVRFRRDWSHTVQMDTERNEK